MEKERKIAFIIVWKSATSEAVRDFFNDERIGRVSAICGVAEVKTNLSIDEIYEIAKQYGIEDDIEIFQEPIEKS